MKAVSHEYYLQNLVNAISEILNNKATSHHIRMNTDRLSLSLVIEFKSKEVFGNKLELELDEFHLHLFGIESLAKVTLQKAIAHLPRADRMERERIWGIK